MKTSVRAGRSTLVWVLCLGSFAYALDEREGFVRQLTKTGDVLTVPAGKRFVIMQMLTREPGGSGGWNLNIDDRPFLNQDIFGSGNQMGGQYEITFPDRCVVVEPGRTLSFEVVYASVSITVVGYFYNFYCDSYPLSDLNKDCRVDLTDLAIMASEWLTDNTA